MSTAIINPQAYMKQGLETIEDCVSLSVPDTEEGIADAIEECRQRGITSVTALSQGSVIAHTRINRALGNVCPSPVALSYGLNKYLMRTLQQEEFWFEPVEPSTESDDTVANKIRQWPVMLKNTSLAFSVGIFRIKNAEQLGEVLREYRADVKLQSCIESMYTRCLDSVPNPEVPPVIPPFIVEQLVDLSKAKQYCYEGYVTADGEVVPYGLSEEVFLTTNEMLCCIMPPLSWTSEFLDQVQNYVKGYMKPLVELGFVNQFFNIEFWVIEGEIYLVELNPRCAHCFHYAYETSFGNHLYADNVRLCSGEPLTVQTPWAKLRSGGRYPYTAVVYLATEKTGRVGDILDFEYVESLEAAGTRVRIVVPADRVLTEKDIGAGGANLGMAWLVGSTPAAVIEAEREFRKQIYRSPETVPYPAVWNNS